jgi:hypothetical protein
MRRTTQILLASAAMALLMVGVSKVAWSQTLISKDSSTSLGISVTPDLMNLETWGVRFGLGHRMTYRGNTYDGAKPIINPYYEVPVPNFLMTYEMMISYESFQTMDFFTFRKFRLDSYGFDLKLRSIYGHGETHPYTSFGVEFDVLQDKVDFAIPLTVGMLFDVGRTYELEVAVLATPLVYIGGGLSGYLGATLGLRLPLQMAGGAQ